MWKRIDVIFSLRNPLHIGFLPSKGSVVSPTRYYVPGKNFWGAITKRTTENLFKDPTGKDYQKMGEEIKNNFRFSYFYLYYTEIIYIPSYTDKGLMFGDKNQIDRLEFERKFVGSRVLTEIDRSSGTAKDKKLHEIEFIKDRYKDERGNIEKTRLIGCIWIKNICKLRGNKVKVNNKGIFVDDFNLIEELTLGGEQNYGFGLVELESIPNEKISPINDNLKNEQIKINIEESDPIISHIKYVKNVSFQGDIEILTGRGYKETSYKYKKSPGQELSEPGYYFAPGCFLKTERLKIMTLQWNGIMKFDDKAQV